MKTAANVVRILIFACAFACLSLDSLIYSVSVKNPFIYHVLIFSMLNDIIAFIIGGYYILTMEKRRKTLPTKIDHFICGVEGILWLIYAILKILSGELATATYGLIITILCCVCGVILNQWRQKSILHKSTIPLNQINIGANNATKNSPIVRMLNNPEVEMNNSGITMNNHGVGNMNSAGTERNIGGINNELK